MKQWYVVHTQVNKESYAASQLERQDFDVYFPQYHKTRRHARKTEVVLAPLFPRYLFIHMDLGAQRWRSVASTYGVSGLVSAGNDPLSVPDAVIEAIKSRAGESGVVEIPSIQYQPGEKVTVREGAFEGYTAIFECQDDSDRVSVLINILNRQVRVKTTTGAIDKV